MKDYYSILGVSPHATESEIKNAYRKLAKKFHPDKQYYAGKEVFTNKDFDEVNEAYRILSNKEKKQEYDYKRSHLDVGQSMTERAKNLQAENSFRNGIAALNKKQYHEAADFLRWAVQYNPKKAIYHSKYGLAIGLSGGDLEKARISCEKAIEMEMYNANHYVDLGDVYRIAGLTEKAREKYKEALKWDKNNKKAQEGLKLVKSKGIFKKLFDWK